jgi:squalene-hopene/tetraprenyl-beta-curcumene cyclase
MRPAIPDQGASSPGYAPESQRLQDTVTGAIARACSFLEAGQLANGRWLDFRDQQLISSQWVTAYVASQLVRAGTSGAAVERACAWLLNNRLPQGGWGFNLANPPDADSIANVIHLLVQCERSEPVVAALGEAVVLMSRYWVESVGGYQTYHPIAGDRLRSADSSWCDVHPSVTAMCATALAALDEQAHEQIIEVCAGYLGSVQRPDSLWDAFWWDGVTYATYHAARLLAHVGDTDRVARASYALVRMRCGDGGWGKDAGSEPAPFHTALALSTLLLDPGRHREAIGAGLAWLLRAQERDGGWPSVPILRVPRLQAHAPWRGSDAELVSFTADRNRFFTTATVLSALLDGRRALARKLA